MLKRFLIATAATFLTASLAQGATHTTTKMVATHTSVTTKAHHHHHHRQMKKISMRGDSEVQALNELEASGYRQFKNLHAQGTDFVATATKSGKTYDVTVRPSGTIDTVVV